jgi:hypothetical protein
MRWKHPSKAQLELQAKRVERFQAYKAAYTLWSLRPGDLEQEKLLFKASEDFWKVTNAWPSLQEKIKSFQGDGCPRRTPFLSMPYVRCGGYPKCIHREIEEMERYLQHKRTCFPYCCYKRN